MKHRAGLGLALIVLLLAGVTLFEYATGTSLPLDVLFVNHAWVGESGRMANQTALAFVLFCLALAGIRRGRPGKVSPVDVLVLVLMGWVLLLGSGYLFGAIFLYETPGSLRAAPQTLVCFAILAATLVLVRMERGVFAVLIGRGSGSRIAWIFIPMVVFLPFLFEFIGDWTIEKGHISSNYANALTVALHSLVLFAIALWLADRINQTEGALSRSEKHYRDIFDYTSELIFSVRLDGSFNYVNAAWKSRLGYEDIEVAKLSLQDLVSLERHESERTVLAELASQRVPVKAEWVLLAKDGRRIHVECVPNVTLDNWDGAPSIQFICHDVTEQRLAASWLLDAQQELKSALEREQNLARVDPLTGLYNRRAFFELAGAELARMARNARPVTLAYIDLDHFKKVNDEDGHEAGDMLLVTLSRAMRSCLRATDTVARIGGDEFALLLPETPPQDAKVIMEKLVMLVKQQVRERAWPVTLSVGVVTHMRPAVDVDELMRQADELMYAVKRAGRDQVRHQVYPPD